MNIYHIVLLKKQEIELKKCGIWLRANNLNRRYVNINQSNYDCIQLNIKNVES